MDRIVGIRQAAAVLGVSISTLRRWEAQGKIVAEHTAGGHRRYNLSRLRPELVDDKVGRLVLNHKDRLLRFGAELVFAICEIKGVEIVILNQGEDASFEQDLANDVLEIITVCSARLYGARSQKSKKLVEAIRAATEGAA